MKRHFIILIALLLIGGQSLSQKFQIINAETETGASFRGLSVVDNKVVWVSGSKGWVGRTVNGGKDWRFVQVRGFEAYDFRSLHAFDDKRAIIANAGAPAHILITQDGGRTWGVVYKNEHPGAFLDGITFWNDQEGLIYGDPIEQRMMILFTRNGGKTWIELTEAQKPLLEIGEASFAASGTTIRSQSNGKVIIATGGLVSRLWISQDQGQSWLPNSTPIIQGQSATGIFSFAFWDAQTGVIVGGDYTQDTLKTNHVFLSNDGGYTWQFPQLPTGGYRSCVEYITKDVLIATGTSGVDVSTDGGKNWNPITSDGYHVVRRARNGSLVILAGGGGKVAVLKH